MDPTEATRPITSIGSENGVRDPSHHQRRVSFSDGHRLVVRHDFYLACGRIIRVCTTDESGELRRPSHLRLWLVLHHNDRSRDHLERCPWHLHDAGLRRNRNVQGHEKRLVRNGIVAAA